MNKHDKSSHPKNASLFAAQAKLPAFFAFLALAAAFLLVLAVLFLHAAWPAGIPQMKQQPDVLTLHLPGQQIWKNNVSSFLFGTNDTQEWTARNVENSTAIQQALRDAHFTLMRTFFFEKSLLDDHPTTDAEIEQRLQTTEKSHMICLGVLTAVNNPAFIKHVVRYAGKRCTLYELGNEPDKDGMRAYISSWNRLIPQLRNINPAAKFIGPVVADYTQVQPFLTAVKASGILPDAISFHWYPCGTGDASGACLAKASTFAAVTAQVKEWVRKTLGKNLPVGITEWNYNSDNPPASYGANPTFITQFTAAALHFMIEAGLDFANQFDAASGAGSGGLDMFDVRTGTPKSQFDAVRTIINQYRPAGTS